MTSPTLAISPFGHGRRLLPIVLIALFLPLAAFSGLAETAHAAKANPWNPGDCTWYAADQFNRYAPDPGVNWGGDAGDWYRNAMATKIWHGSSDIKYPRQKAIAVFSRHVAIVESFTSRIIVFREMNWGPNNYHKVTTSLPMTYDQAANRDGQAFYGYIYPSLARYDASPYTTQADPYQYIKKPDAYDKPYDPYAKKPDLYDTNSYAYDKKPDPYGYQPSTQSETYQSGTRTETYQTWRTYWVIENWRLVQKREPVYSTRDVPVYSTRPVPSYASPAPSYNTSQAPAYDSYQAPTYDTYQAPAYNSYQAPAYNTYQAPAYSSRPSSYSTYQAPGYSTYLGYED